MPSYQERSELNRRLADQAYFDAKRKKIEPQKKDVRIGGMDGQTGRYQVFHADGGFSNNGVRTFDGTPPSDRFVRGQQNPNSNAIALGYRDYVRTEFVNRVEEEIIPILLPLRLLRIIPRSTPSLVVFVAEWFFFPDNPENPKPENQALQNQLWSESDEIGDEFLGWDEPTFPTGDLPDRNTFRGVWALRLGGLDNPVDPNTLTYTYSANEEWMEFTGFFGGFTTATFGYFLDITFFADPEIFPFIQEIDSQLVTNISEIEAEMETNIGTFQDIEYRNFGSGFFGFTISSFFPDNGSTTGDTYSFRFRYRRRVTSGDPLPWFQL